MRWKMAAMMSHMEKRKKKNKWKCTLIIDEGKKKNDHMAENGIDIS